MANEPLGTEYDALPQHTQPSKSSIDAQVEKIRKETEGKGLLFSDEVVPRLRQSLINERNIEIKEEEAERLRKIRTKDNKSAPSR